MHNSRVWEVKVNKQLCYIICDMLCNAMVMVELCINDGMNFEYQTFKKKFPLLFEAIVWKISVFLASSAWLRSNRTHGFSSPWTVTRVVFIYFNVSYAKKSYLPPGNILIHIFSESAEQLPLSSFVKVQNTQNANNDVAQTISCIKLF